MNHNSFFSFLLTVSLLGGTACSKIELPETEIPRGGVSFDFAALSEKRFAAAFDPAKNILKKPVAEKLTKTWKRSFDLPHTNGGSWRVSCRYRMYHAKKGNTARYIVSPGGGNKYIQESGQWSALSQVARVPKGESKVTVMFNLWEPVEFEFKDLSIVDVTPKNLFETWSTHGTALDGTFQISQGQIGIVEFLMRKSTPAFKVEKSKLSYEVTLPKGISFVGANYALKETIKTKNLPDGRTVTTFKTPTYYGPPVPGNDYVGWTIWATVLKADGPIRHCGHGSVTVCYENNGTITRQTACELDFSIVPNISSKVATVYDNGLMPDPILMQQTSEVRNEMVRFFREAGATWMSVSKYPKAQIAKWREIGMRRVLNVAFHFENGFMITPRYTVPESDQYLEIQKDGSLKPRGAAVCPVSVYERSEYFRKVTEPYIRDYIQGTDGSWANWEPGSFRGKGCMCDKCCHKFAAYIKKPYEVVKAKWEELAHIATSYRIIPGEKPYPMVIDQLTWPYARPGRHAEIGGGLFASARNMIHFFDFIAKNGVTSDGRRLISTKLMDEWFTKQVDSGAGGYSFGMTVNPAGDTLSHASAYKTHGSANRKTREAAVLLVSVRGRNAGFETLSKAYNQPAATEGNRGTTNKE